MDWGNSQRVYFFKQDRYWRWNTVEPTSASGYPFALAPNWRNPDGVKVPNPLQGFDAVLNYGNGKVYFFKGDKYYRYDKAADKFDQGEAAISSYWNIPPSFIPLDDAIYWGNDSAGRKIVYLFKGSQFVAYLPDTNTMSSWVTPLSLWEGWPDGFWPIDTAVEWPNGRVYFFKGSQYIRLNKSSGAIDQGPTSIGANWADLPGDIEAAVNYDMY